jgi:hypothetical protein
VDFKAFSSKFILHKNKEKNFILDYLNPIQLDCTWETGWLNNILKVNSNIYIHLNRGRQSNLNTTSNLGLALILTCWHQVTNKRCVNFVLIIITQTATLPTHVYWIFVHLDIVFSDSEVYSFWSKIAKDSLVVAHIGELETQ